MSQSAETRARLAAQQAALVTALVAQGEPPADFDAVRLLVVSKSLLRKRARTVARAWPGMTQALGRRFDELFTIYAEGATLPRLGGPLADGRAFACWLAAQGGLPEAGQLQKLAVDLRFTHHPDGLVPRRGLTATAAWLRQSRRLIVAVWLPWFGEHWLSIPLSPLRKRAIT